MPGLRRNHRRGNGAGPDVGTDTGAAGATPSGYGSRQRHRRTRRSIRERHGERTPLAACRAGYRRPRIPLHPRDHHQRNRCRPGVPCPGERGRRSPGPGGTGRRFRVRPTARRRRWACPGRPGNPPGDHGDRLRTALSRRRVRLPADAPTADHRGQGSPGLAEAADVRRQRCPGLARRQSASASRPRAPGPGRPGALRAPGGSGSSPTRPGHPAPCCRCRHAGRWRRR